MNENEELGILDIVTILGFGAQLKNMAEDELEQEYIHKVIKAIANEIEKLHRENDIIIEKLDTVLEKLNGINS